MKLFASIDDPDKLVREAALSQHFATSPERTILLSRFKSAMNHPCLRTFDFDTLAENDLPRLKQHHNLFSSGNGLVSSHSQLPSQSTETLPANIPSAAPTLSTAVPMSSAPSTISVAPPLNNANSPTVPTSTLPMTADEVTAVQATAVERTVEVTAVEVTAAEVTAVEVTAAEVTAAEVTAAEVDSALPRTHDIGMLSPIPPVPNQINESIDHPSSTSSDKLLPSKPSLTVVCSSPMLFQEPRCLQVSAVNIMEGRITNPEMGQEIPRSDTIHIPSSRNTRNPNMSERAGVPSIGSVSDRENQRVDLVESATASCDVLGEANENASNVAIPGRHRAKRPRLQPRRFEGFVVHNSNR